MDTPLKLNELENVEVGTPNISHPAPPSTTTTTTPIATKPINPLLAVQLFRATKPVAPSKELLESLYHLAVEDKESHQSYLVESSVGDCIVLSLEDVWLPAAVYQIQTNLKTVQAKIQRDGSKEQVHQMENARRYLLNQLKRSLKVAQSQRMLREHECQTFLQQEKDRQRQERKEECRRQKEAKQKNHPYNQDLWREAAALMTELQKLEKEEHLWDEALHRLPSELEQRSLGVPPPATVPTETMEVEDYSEHKPITEELDTTMQLLDDLQLWTRRVRTSVAQIQPAMDRAEALRKELYQQHQNSRFKGYPGMEQPKDLLRILSQDGEAHN